MNRDQIADGEEQKSDESKRVAYKLLERGQRSDKLLTALLNYCQTERPEDKLTNQTL